MMIESRGGEGIGDHLRWWTGGSRRRHWRGGRGGGGAAWGAATSRGGSTSRRRPGGPRWPRSACRRGPGTPGAPSGRRTGRSRGRDLQARPGGQAMDAWMRQGGEKGKGRKRGGRGWGEVTVGVLEGEVVADEPAAGGAEHDDVAAGRHGRHHAVAPRGLPLQRVHGEQLPAAGFHGWTHGWGVSDTCWGLRGKLRSGGGSTAVEVRRRRSYSWRGTTGAIDRRRPRSRARGDWRGQWIAGAAGLWAVWAFIWSDPLWAQAQSWLGFYCKVLQAVAFPALTHSLVSTSSHHITLLASYPPPPPYNRSSCLQ